jgi:hypothetical protein
LSLTHVKDALNISLPVPNQFGAAEGMRWRGFTLTRQIRFNAFDMNCVGHQSPGLWAHPRDRSWRYKDLEYWTDVARTLERGIFDGIFIADVIGYYDVYQGSAAHAIAQAADPGERSDPACLCDIPGDEASGLWHYRLNRVRAPLPIRAPAGDRRPPLGAAGLSSLRIWKAAPATPARTGCCGMTTAMMSPTNILR